MNPITDQQLDEIEQRANAATPGPWTESGIGDYGWGVGSPAEHIVEADDSEQGRANAAFIAHARTDVEQLVAEVRRLRAELATALRPTTPRLCECGHSNLAHTVPAPHSCFAYGRTCDCPAYRQLPHDEAMAQLDRNLRAAAERMAVAEPDPVCGDANDGDWCELEPGHEGHHRADTAEWAATP